MNLVDIVIIIILAISFMSGFKKGIGSKVINFFFSVLAIFITFKFFSVITGYILKFTNIYGSIYDGYYSKIISSNNKGVLDVITQFFYNNSANDTATFLTNITVNAISIVLFLIFIHLLMIIPKRIINKILHLPILNEANKVIGGFIGLVLGIIFITIILIIVVPLSLYISVDVLGIPTLKEYIDGSLILKSFMPAVELFTRTNFYKR